MEVLENKVEDSKSQIEVWGMKSNLNDLMNNMTNKELIEYFKNQHKLLNELFDKKSIRAFDLKSSE